MMKHAKRISPIIFPVFVLLVLLNSSRLLAQIVPASNPSIPLSIHNYAYPCSTDVSVFSVSALNCDMISANSYNIPFWAIAYTVEDDGMKVPPSCFFYSLTPTAYSGIHVEYDNPWLPIPAWNLDEPIVAGWNPDIVISTANGGPGPLTPHSFLMAVVYENNTGVEIATIPVYDLVAGVTNVTLGTLSAGVQLNNPANGRIARNAHIDLFGESSASGNIKNQFIATWEEFDPNTNTNYIMAATGMVGNLASINIYQITPNNPGDPEGILPDVGAMGVNTPCLGCAPYRAFITYIDPANSNALMLTDLDVFKSSLAVNSHTTLANGHTAIGKPRIDAKVFGNVVSGEATWDVVASIDPGSGFYEIHSFNDATTPAVCTLNANEQHFSPVVSGIGEDMDPANTGKVGETQFSLAYYTTFTNSGPGNGDIFANSIDIVGGAMTNTNYYEVNDQDLFQPAPYMTADEIPVAIASSGDDGNDLLTVWYQGYDPMFSWGEFHYKFSGNSYAFKPTGTINVNPARVGIYPNPVSDLLHIAKVNGADVAISDMAGRVLYKGHVNNDDFTIDMKAFSPGMYMVDINRNNISHKQKIVKQ